MMTLSELKSRIDTLLGTSSDIVVTEANLEEGPRIVLEALSPTGIRRYLRINATGETEWEFALLWMSSGSPDQLRNSSGRAVGSGSLVLTAIQHFFIDAMVWEDVPEFRPPGR